MTKIAAKIPTRILANDDALRLDKPISELDEAKHEWAQTGNGERIDILTQIKDNLLPLSENWAQLAARKKFIPLGSPLEGEEWLSGPYALMSMCNALIDTLSQMDGKKFLDNLHLRELTSGQIAVQVIPNSVWDRMILSGVKAEIWMQNGITRQNLKRHTASSYDIAFEKRKGKISLVLGAGNIASIPGLDCFQKLFVENQVVILKMNPINDYLTEFLLKAFEPLIDRNALRIVKGGAQTGQYLCNHPKIAEIHITGSQASHDIIVWGRGKERIKNKKAGMPINERPITSELGAVCPTIVVPGPWTKADIKFQAEHIASQKMHNSGFNCISCQKLILPSSWDKADLLMAEVEKVIEQYDPRQLYYPGADERMREFENHAKDLKKFGRQENPACVVASHSKTKQDWFNKFEIFAPAMSIHEIDDIDTRAYLNKAINFSNDELHGTLGANILIHPSTIKDIGKENFESIIARLNYGCIAINAWTGLGFLLVQTPWGAFPGHKLDDVQSGLGFVHNSFMLDSCERTIISAPLDRFQEIY